MGGSRAAPQGNTPASAELIQINAPTGLLDQLSLTENADMPDVVGTVTEDNVEHAAKMLHAAADARKCWACGCLRHTLETIDHADSVAVRHHTLDAALAAARDHLLPQRYECLGCDICFPAVALNAHRNGSLVAQDCVSARQRRPAMPLLRSRGRRLARSHRSRCLPYRRCYAQRRGAGQDLGTRWAS
jgi:hypothetical protein